jgi:RNA polymerase sigma-70 factor (ECF subfamily)
MAPSCSASHAGDPGEDSSRGDDGAATIDVHARACLAALFDRHESQVFGFLVARTGDRALAEDLTTETFLAVARRAAREPSAVEGLSASSLVTIARRRLIDHWRAHAARQRRLDAVRAAMATSLVDRGPGATLDGVDERVLEALAALPTRQRAALTLHHLDELSITEVAEIVGSTYRATESILARARQSFRDAYEALGEPQ